MQFRGGDPASPNSKWGGASPVNVCIAGDAETCVLHRAAEVAVPVVGILPDAYSAAYFRRVPADRV